MGQFPQWLHVLSTISLMAGGICALVIGLDVLIRRQRMWIMDVVWPITRLYSGPLSLWGYFRIGRLFVDKCSACHGINGYGDGPWHTEFTPQPANLSLAHNSPSMVRSIILNGIPGTMMPAFPDMSNEIIENALLYVSLQLRDLSHQWG